MIMTSSRARKIATRERMAETGEPYTVAKRATEAGPLPQPGDIAEERYGGEAAADVVPAADGELVRAIGQARTHADELRRAAQQARQRADQAEDAAAEAEERAEYAGDAADLAQGWAGEHDRRLAQEQADQMRRAAEDARQRADQVEEAAEQAEDAAHEAAERVGDLMASASEPDEKAKEDADADEVADADARSWL
jgi:hypothetical protein